MRRASPTTPRARSSSSRTRCPARRSQVAVQRRKSNWEQARRRLGDPRRERAARAAALPALRRLRRLQDAAPARLGAQVATKQRALEDALWHLGKVRPERVLRPIEGPAWGYRQRARLSVRHVVRKGKVLVGFHERQLELRRRDRRAATCCRRTSAPCCCRCASSSMRWTAAIGCRRSSWRSAGDDGARPAPPRAAVGADLDRLRVFAARHGVEWWLQPKGPESAHVLDGVGSPASPTSCPSSAIRMPFRPTDFTQVNQAINRVLVARAVGLARSAARRRSDRLVLRPRQFHARRWRRGRPRVTGHRRQRGAARAGARRARPLNGLAGHDPLRRRRPVRDRRRSGSSPSAPPTRWLLDPPREGAFAIVKALAELARGQRCRPAGARRSRIVYVSCNPATLARDAGLLVHRAGYRCRPPASSTCFRTPRTSRAWRCSIASTKPARHRGRPSRARQAPMKTAPGPGGREGRVRAGVRPGRGQAQSRAAGDAEDREQRREHVVEADVDAERGGDVVALVAELDALQVVDDEGREDADRDAPRP